MADNKNEVTLESLSELVKEQTKQIAELSEKANIQEETIEALNDALGKATPKKKEAPKPPVEVKIDAKTTVVAKTNKFKVLGEDGARLVDLTTKTPAECVALAKKYPSMFDAK